MQEEKQSYRWIIAPIIYSGAIMMALIWNSIGPMMLTIIEELQISFTKAGLLSGVVAFVLGIFAFVSGSIAGRIGLLFYTGIFFTIPMELKGMTPKTTGFMIGIITCIGMQFGFIAPIIVGWIEAITGSLKGGLLFYGFFGFLMAILPIFIEETGPNAKKGRI